MNKIQKRLFEYKDDKYALFQAGLIPSANKLLFMGVRMPDIKALAKQLIKENDYDKFLQELPHKYFDENALHGAIISQIKDYDECITYIDEFLPYIDNWAVCDSTNPKCFKKHKDLLISKIQEWTKSSQVYTCRFGIEILMNYYLDDDFDTEYLKIPARVHLDDYYVKMMQAWFYATALAKKWDETIIYLQDNKLDSWVHNKTIQKAIESYRITDSQKTYLRTLKRLKEDKHGI